MCGIFGAVMHRPTRLDAETAVRSLLHRGPDEQKVQWQGQEAVLGHTRLAIIDLTPAGSQPMESSDAQAVVVFNGEIYNHHALRAELIAAGHRFRSRCDTEVIVEGYRAWGDAVVDRLDGM